MADWDFAVVGSGAAGGALAARLAQGGARVLLVERGGEAKPEQDAFEAVYRYYTHGGLFASVGNCLLPIPTGTTLGGTTTINSGTCFKTPAEFLRRWESMSGGSFSAGGFEAYLDQAWKSLNVQAAPPETMSTSTRLFLSGLERLGVKGGRLLDRATDDCRGSGLCCFVCPKDAKVTSERAFLRSRPKGLEILVRTELDGAREDRDGVTLELKSADGKRRRVRCGRLVLACGALSTPYFVRCLRLGPRWRLAGDNLSIHPATKVFAHFDEPVRGWLGVPQGAGFEDPEEPHIRYEGIYTPPEMAAITMPIEGRALSWWLNRYDHVATFGLMIRDSNSGRVRYPLGKRFPLVRYDLADGDVGRMARGMRFAARAFFAAGARRVVIPLNRGPNTFDGAEALDAADLSEVRARDLQMMGFHPLGTCAAGRVTGWDLSLTDRVFACDGSVVPESLGVNPQITIYAFALRLADRLLAR